PFIHYLSLHDALPILMEDILTNNFFFWFYIISILAVVFHLANGLWGFLVSWGIAQSPKSQRIVTYATVVVFFVVSYIGIRTIIQDRKSTRLNSSQFRP